MNWLSLLEAAGVIVVLLIGIYQVVHIQLKPVYKEVSDLKVEVKDIKGDVKNLKENHIDHLEKDVAQLKTDVEWLKGSMVRIETKLDKVLDLLLTK